MKNVTIAKKNRQGRGRPRAFDVEKAVETAMALFHDRGYDGVGVAELSQAIGVKAPSLYAAFGSKKGLFERALERYLTGEGGYVAAALAEGGDVAETIARVFARAAETFSAPGGLPGCLVSDSTRNCTDPEARELTAKLGANTRELVRRRIASDYPDQAEILTDYVLVTLAGLSGAARDGMSAASLKASAGIAAAGFAAQLPQKG